MNRFLLCLTLAACPRPVEVPTVIPVMPELAPRDAKLAYGRAAYAEAVADAEEAARQWAWVRRLDSANPWAWLAAARGARAAGDLESAHRYLDEAEVLAPALDALAWERALTRAASGEDADEDLCTAAAELEGRWGEALSVATDPARVLDAWLAVDISGHEHAARSDAAATLGRWEEAAADQGRAVLWVPSPQAFVVWVERCERACTLAAPRAWVQETHPENWGSAWSPALDRLTSARCASE